MHIAICAFDGVGHLNPLLAIASKLARSEKGHKIRFYLMSDIYEESIRKVPFLNADVRKLVEEGKHFSSLIPTHEEQDESDMKLNDLSMSLVAHAFKYMPQFLDELKEFGTDLIIYDPFVLSPIVAAKVLDIACCCTITVSNFNQYTMLCDRHSEEDKRQRMEECKQSTTLSKYHRLFLDKYNFDIFKDTILMNNCLPKGLNICSGIKEFELKMPDVVKEVYGEMDKDCVYVGPMLLSKEEGRISAVSDVKQSEHQWIDEPFPSDELQQYKKQGKTIVYASFGTVATSPHFWNLQTVNKVFGASASGKEFSRNLWQKIFKAFGWKDKYVVVMATVAKDPNALEGLEVPSNFIVRRKCPQLEILKVADAFITHGGANSMMESIHSRVPMLVLPWFSDQYDNAKMVTKQGVGLHYDKPLTDCTPDSLVSDVEKLLADQEIFKSHCGRLHESLDKAGGTEEACAAIEKYVAHFQGHGKKRKECLDSSQPDQTLHEQCRSKNLKEESEQGSFDDYVYVSHEMT